MARRQQDGSVGAGGLGGRAAAAVRAVGRGAVLALIYLYQGVSSVTPGCCRFEPSCSHYGLEAVRVHGPLLGGWLAFRRVLRCRPGGGWGVDPVPAPEELRRPQAGTGHPHAPRGRAQAANR
jgi:putative membrane protein insertion efficiency factor